VERFNHNDQSRRSGSNVSHPLNCSYENGFVPCLNDVYPTLGSASASVYGSIVRLGINYQFR
jgi:hypothetical protein